MKVTLSQLIGAPIISEQAEGPIALVRNVIFDPTNGGIIAISTVISKKIIATTDIRKWNLEGIMVVDESALIDRDELVRLKGHTKEETSIFSKPVFKKDGKFLGVVHDFVIDTDVGQLLKIYVVKKFLIIPLEKRIIDFREIVEVKEDRIIVKNDLAESKESVADFFALRKSVNMKAAV